MAQHLPIWACRCCIMDIIQIQVHTTQMRDPVDLHVLERDIQIYTHLDLSLFPQHYSFSCFLRLALIAAAVVSNLSFSQWPSIPTAVKRLLLRLDTWFEKVVTYLLWIILPLRLEVRTFAPALSLLLVSFDCTDGSGWTLLIIKYFINLINNNITVITHTNKLLRTSLILSTIHRMSG